MTDEEDREMHRRFYIWTHGMNDGGGEFDPNLCRSAQFLKCTLNPDMASLTGEMPGAPDFPANDHRWRYADPEK